MFDRLEAAGVIFLLGCALASGCGGSRAVQIRGGADGVAITVEGRVVRFAAPCSQVSVENRRIRASCTGREFAIEGTSIRIDGRGVSTPPSWQRVEITFPDARTSLRFDDGRPVEWTAR